MGDTSRFPLRRTAEKRMKQCQFLVMDMLRSDRWAMALWTVKLLLDKYGLKENKWSRQVQLDLANQIPGNPIKSH